MLTCKRVGHVRSYDQPADVAHIVCLDEGPLADGGPATCGHWPYTGRWFATGTQKHLDVAKALPLCQDCHKAVNLPVRT